MIKCALACEQGNEKAAKLKCDMAEAKLFFDEFRKFELQQSAFSSPPDHNFGLMIGLCMRTCICVGAALDRKYERVHAALSCHKVLC